MGVVYQADDDLLNEIVALKFMRPHLLRTQKGQQLFIQEAQLARRLRHENIVAVHDVSATQEGILYLSMEFLEGRSLRHFLRSHRNSRKLIDVRLAVRVISQTLAALEYAHRTVVHRDVKPENIMLLPGEHVKVLDFGLAKAIEDLAATPASQDNKPKRPAGTTAYLAPEQKLHRNIDLRADLYTVGLVLREMLNLRTPNDEPRDISLVRDDVAPSLLEIVERAIRPDAEARWQSARDFRRALLQAYEQSYRSAYQVRPSEDGVKAASTEDMVFMEGGSFLMGSNASPSESPEREVEVEPFFIDMFPVTVDQYAQFLKETGHTPPKFWGKHEYSGAQQPVVGVTWEDAAAYASWAGKELPMEAQWEYAARGKENRRYPWGSSEPDSNRANYGDFLSIPSIVTMHEEGATPTGVCDLAGNVYEWTRDWFAPYGQQGRANHPPSGELPRRAVRGGSWESPPTELRCTFRKGLFPETQLATVGFRCVVAVDHAADSGAKE
jgi:formylglycine-generating enzyme required for sulfatase activity